MHFFPSQFCGVTDDISTRKLHFFVAGEVVCNYETNVDEEDIFLANLQVTWSCEIVSARGIVIKFLFENKC